MKKRLKPKRHLLYNPEDLIKIEDIIYIKRKYGKFSRQPIGCWGSTKTFKPSFTK